MFVTKYKLSDIPIIVFDDAGEEEFIELVHNDKTIKMDWEWIPVLDFALSVFTLSKSLLNEINDVEVFEFT